MEEYKKFPFFNKILYSLGTTGYSTLEMFIVFYLVYYYAPPEGSPMPQLVPIPILAVIMVFGRIIDSVADPIIASYSDKAEFRLGRRIPFLILSLVPLVLTAIFLFYPVYETKHILNSIYLISMLSFYFISYTLYVIPYSGLLPELARTHKDRIDLTTMQAVAGLIGIAIGMVLSSKLIGRFGYHGMIVSLGFLSGMFLLLPIIGVNEREYCRAKPTKFSLFDSIGSIFKNRPFLIYLSGFLCFRIGFYIIVIAVNYYVSDLLGLKISEAFIFTFPAFIAGIVAFPIVNILGKKKGNKFTMMLSMAICVIILPFTMLIGKELPFISPEGLMMLFMIAGGLTLPAMFVIPNAIVADLTDLEEKITGERHEAMYYGAQGLFTKFVLGFSAMFMLSLLAFFGRELGVRLTGPLAAFFILIGFLIMRKYPEEEAAPAKKS